MTNVQKIMPYYIPYLITTAENIYHGRIFMPYAAAAWWVFEKTDNMSESYVLFQQMDKIKNLTYS